MGLNAQQIIDFNNFNSVEHSEFSIQSFKPVSDLLTIKQVQCTTPETLPGNYFYGDHPRRSLYEQACFSSHYNLVLKLSQGEKFIIMEHDAYLWPQDTKLFRFLFSQVKAFEIFYLGIANEFYTLSKVVAESYVNRLHKKQVYGGPMFHIGECYERHVKKPGMLVCWPVDGQKNLICVSNSVKDSAMGKGVVYRAPITQHFKLSTGSTIKSRKNKWVTTKQNSPNMFFSE